jgi:uncharacterized membrane protein YebE (DUF533 family)
MSYGSMWVLREEEGFSGLPRTSDLEIYMKSLLICANGDGRITEHEREWVLGIASAMGLPDDTVERLKGYEAKDDLNSLLAGGVETGKGAPRSLIYNAIRACMADGELSEGELATIQTAASIMNVPEAVVGELKELVVQQAKLRERRLELVFPEGIPY